MMHVEAEIAARVALGLMILALGCIGLPQRLRADRAGGHVPARVDPAWFWIGMGLAGPPAAIVVGAFLVAPRWVDFARIDLPPALRLAGIPIAATGVALFAWMFRHLGANVTSTSAPRAGGTLVMTGPYRWVRHPMYSAALILAIAATLLTANVVVAIGGGAMFALLAARSRIEEARLVDKFGDAYRAYRHRTGRFVPRRWRGMRE